ncbi:MAG: HPF/RaiA family ribosome-associated protein [Gammaproteobacteria bacterium]|nr:HPF/RaiA family ribosome-associated protein [Gammaproteobacteria bacterium]
MKLPLQITWRDVPKSEALEADIRSKAEKLAQFSEHIMSCRVIVGASHRHHQQGNLYNLHIAIKVPGKEIVVTREPNEKQAHKDMYVSIRDAFNAARRQLQEYVKIRQGEAKQRE